MTMANSGMKGLKETIPKGTSAPDEAEGCVCETV